MSKSTILILAIFGLLLAGVLVTMREKPERGITRISFAHVDPGTITRVVTSGKYAVTLEKVGERWRVGDGKRADAAAVKRLLDAIPKVVSADVVTRNPERFAAFEVDEKNGTLVQAFAGDKDVARFTVGKIARGGSHLLVDDAVYAVKDVYGGLFARAESAWIERKLFDAKVDDIARIEIRPKDVAAYALVKQEDGWELEDPSILPDGFRFDKNAARTLARAAIDVRAKDILDADPGVETTGLDDDASSLAIIGNGGRTLRLKLGNEGEGGAVYAHADGWDEIVTLHENTARQLLKAATDLRDLSLMDFEPEEVTRLAFEEGERRLVFENDGGTWKIEDSTEEVPEDFVLSEPKLYGRIRGLRGARALVLAPEAEQKELGKPSASVTAVLGDGRSATLAFGRQTTHDDREALFARGNADERVYLVAQTTRDTLLGGFESFAQGEQAAGLGNIDPASLSNLPPEVREALQKKIEEEKRKQELLRQ